MEHWIRHNPFKIDPDCSNSVPTQFDNKRVGLSGEPLPFKTLYFSDLDSVEIFFVLYNLFSDIRLQRFEIGELSGSVYGRVMGDGFL